MSLSTCEKCGGHIPLGPAASNRCETCGAGVFDTTTEEAVRATLHNAAADWPPRLAVEGLQRENAILRRQVDVLVKWIDDTPSSLCPFCHARRLGCGNHCRDALRQWSENEAKKGVK